MGGFQSTARTSEGQGIGLITGIRPQADNCYYQLDVVS